MKKLLNFMLILGIFALNSSLIMSMEEEVPYGPEISLEMQISQQIDAAKKDGDSDIEDLKTNLNALLATENNDELIDTLKKMKDAFFYRVMARVPLTWHGRKFDIKRFNELDDFFLNLIVHRSENFTNENLYAMKKIFNEIIKNIGDKNTTQEIENNLKELTQTDYEFYKFVINQLINPSELANKDFSEGDDGDIPYLKDIEDISAEIQELLINSAGYSKEDAQLILKYTLQDNGFIDKISKQDKEAYFDFLKNLLLALGDKANLNNFAQEAADANEKFKGYAWDMINRRTTLPAYTQVFIALGGQEISPTAPEAPKSDLGTALTQLSVELTSLNAQL